ncbi:MAG: UDP-glucose 4-epimerase, partial [Acidobacteria bacterium]|nr:UDP-glucose 4-epimerase [Acidobacteriota bacterium]
EFLIGEIELPYAAEVFYDDVKHYIISFNEKAENPIDFGLSSANTERLTRDEMLSLINNSRD